RSGGSAPRGDPRIHRHCRRAASRRAQGRDGADVVLFWLALSGGRSETEQGMKIAGVQMDVTLGDVSRNLERMGTFLRESVAQGAKLTVFPECAVSGYCFGSVAEALPYAQSIPGPATEFVRRACAELGCYAIFGMLEQDGGRVFNAAVLV